MSPFLKLMNVLPLALPFAIHVATLVAQYTAGNNVFKILIVDDDKLMNRVLTRLLESFGFSACSTTRGDEALRHLAENQMDLILLDVNMPEMSGLEVLRRIRSDPALQLQKVIMY